VCNWCCLVYCTATLTYYHAAYVLSDQRYGVVEYATCCQYNITYLLAHVHRLFGRSERCRRTAFCIEDQNESLVATPSQRGRISGELPRLIAVYYYEIAKPHRPQHRRCSSEPQCLWARTQLYHCSCVQSEFYIIKMPSFRLNPRILPRALHSRTYATAQAPAINVTNVPAPHCGSIRILSLNRPAARNAISRQLLAELSHQVNSIHSEGDNGSTRALILASEVDTSFCAGADLKERATFTHEEYV
jgi:hypothetical protein